MTHVTVEDLKKLVDDTIERQEYYLSRANKERHAGRIETSNQWFAQAGVLTTSIEAIQALIRKENGIT